MVVAVALIVGAAGLVVLVVMLVSLVRQTMRVAGAVSEFERAVRPVLEEISADSARSQARMQGFVERRSRMARAKARRR
jgi:hypothetical protein